MKILLVADNEEPYIWDHFDHERFKEIEMIISCGDVKAEYLAFLVTMIKAPLFYIPGNHNVNYLKHPPEGCECIDGKLIKYKGIRLLGLGGSQCYSKEEFQYTEKQMNRRVLRMKPKIWWNKGFDILVTHAPAYQLGDGEDLCHRGFKCFVKLMDEYTPKYLVHGHQHLNYNLQPRIIQYKDTTIVNAYGYFILDY